MLQALGLAAGGYRLRVGAAIVPRLMRLPSQQHLRDISTSLMVLLWWRPSSLETASPVRKCCWLGRRINRGTIAAPTRSGNRRLPDPGPAAFRQGRPTAARKPLMVPVAAEIAEAPASVVLPNAPSPLRPRRARPRPVFSPCASRPFLRPGGARNSCVRIVPRVRRSRRRALFR